MMRAVNETVMLRCTKVVNWLDWSFVVQVGAGSMVWAFDVRSPISVKKLRWCSVGLAWMGRRVRV